MRICRYEHNGAIGTGFYDESGVIPVEAAARRCGLSADVLPPAIADDPVLLCQSDAAHAVADRIAAEPDAREALQLPLDSVLLRTPVAAPPKILLLAGNYAAHIEEEGKVALERAETFPYLFMKPATTLNDPNANIAIPRVSPGHIDYECELAIVMGRTARHVAEGDALAYVAGYTVLNDISDRRYRPFPERRERERDAFFDWQHGKWHDGFCPVGPCVRSARSMPDPQRQRVTTHVNGEVRQDGSTAQMIFPVAAIVAFISEVMTLQPGDLIATGTPAGVGATTGQYLRAGDRIEAAVAGIGVLRNTFHNEAG